MSKQRLEQGICTVQLLYNGLYFSSVHYTTGLFFRFSAIAAKK